MDSPAANRFSDLLRVHTVMQSFLTDTLDMLEELAGLQARRVPDPDMNDPELQRKLEEARRKVAEMMAEIGADIEEERRTGKQVRP